MDHLDVSPNELLLFPPPFLALQSYMKDNFHHANLPLGFCVSATSASSRSTSTTDTSNKTGAPANPTLLCDILHGTPIEKHPEIEACK
jgi:hypothetical protein